MGSKRNKLKKVLSPSSTSSPPLPEDDADLMDDLMTQLDSRDKNVQVESANMLQDMQSNHDMNIAEQASQKQDAKSRYQARQARKAAAIAETYAPVDEASDERLRQEARNEVQSIKKTCESLGVTIHDINPDGHCLFSAIGDQLALLKIIPPDQADYKSVRYAASNYIHSHPNDFLPFLPSSGGEDGVGATDAGFMTRAQFERYCVSIRDTGVWGGEPEILALSRAYNIPIHVVQGGQPPIVVHNPTGAPQEHSLNDKRVVRISYHRRMYGLGEHYNSLHPSTGLTRVSDKLSQFLDPS
ncbi:cysteine proteinase [Athelia psychrophila]|uniref:Cysteine proteinase n=1 Tax=Athelia psychrophila TaxID=1759441 RepID=A0A166NBU3_9AGAM|nr:cysteine proteinase [Fibularhizoctonia sp. CBS 109695]